MISETRASIECASGNADRSDLDEFRSIANTLQQAEKYGTPLAQALRVLGADFRQERLTKAEEKAARLPAILTATRDKPAVRRRAVIALTPFEGPEVEAAMRRARTDRDWQVREAAEQLGDGEGEPG